MMRRRRSEHSSRTPASVGVGRRRALRALLSALAGGGLTAGLGGALVPSASAQIRSEAGGSGKAWSTSGSSPSSTVEEAQGTQPTTTGTETTGSGTTGSSTTPSAPPPATTTTSTTPAPTSPSGTATTPQAATPSAKREAPTVVLQRKQKTSKASNPNLTATAKSKRKHRKQGAGKNSAGNNVAASPQSVAELAALEAILDSSNASDEALQFYRIPLFLLPIYKSAAVQYGVPWQILAAINEIETDFGSDLSVSTAGAVGWMQFMPETWLQYGVDALNAGYADPYNPVDAIFAAARYLRAAGAATNLKAAIFAYNHSAEYVSSVLLRAKLISTYPNAIIATLTGLIDGRLPVTGRQLSWATPEASAAPASSSNATAGATAVGAPTTTPGTSAGAAEASSGVTPGTTTAPAPTTAAASAGEAASAAHQPLQLSTLTSAPEASVVAVQDGRVIKMGRSHALGTYIVLRDVYGDVFTYAGLGSLAASYAQAPPAHAAAQASAVQAASTRAPTPKGPASAGTQPPLTLNVKSAGASPALAGARTGQVTIAPVANEGAPAGMNRVRLYLHPHNPDARAAAIAQAEERARSASASQRQRLRVGSIVPAGAVLGKVSVSSPGASGQLRFAIQPAGDAGTINPGPVLANWAQLQQALHPQGATASNPLLGATASDVLLMSQSQLQTAVLTDPEIQIYGCGRRDIAAGLINRRVLAVLAFLARSGLEPTVDALRCGQVQYTPAGTFSPAYEGDAVGISAINGVAIAHHQGAGTITDLTIRTLLTLPHEFLPQEILSLMRYPEAPSTSAHAAYADQIGLVFARATAPSASLAHVARRPAAAALAAHPLSAIQWNQLMTRVSALPFPTIATKPSSAAVRDPKPR